MFDNLTMPEIASPARVALSSPTVAYYDAAQSDHPRFDFCIDGVRDFALMCQAVATTEDYGVVPRQLVSRWIETADLQISRAVGERIGRKVSVVFTEYNPRGEVLYTWTNDYVLVAASPDSSQGLGSVVARLERAE